MHLSREKLWNYSHIKHKIHDCEIKTLEINFDIPRQPVFIKYLAQFDSRKCYDIEISKIIDAWPECSRFFYSMLVNIEYATTLAIKRKNLIVQKKPALANGIAKLALYLRAQPWYRLNRDNPISDSKIIVDVAAIVGAKIPNDFHISSKEQQFIFYPSLRGSLVYFQAIAIVVVGWSPPLIFV